jgi:hypothetical protein
MTGRSKTWIGIGGCVNQSELWLEQVMALGFDIFKIKTIEEEIADIED